MVPHIFRVIKEKLDIDLQKPQDKTKLVLANKCLRDYELYNKDDGELSIEDWIDKWIATGEWEKNWPTTKE